MPSHKAFGGSGPKLIAVSWTLGTIGLIAVIIRWFHARKTPNGKWRWDYIWAHITAKFSLVAVFCLTVAISRGFGNDIWNITYEDLTYAIFFTFLSLSFGVLALVFARLSVISLLLKIEEGLGRKRRIVLITIAIVFTIVSILVIPANYTRCTPVVKVWDVASPGTCDIRFSRYMGMVQSYVTGVCDIILALWPISIVAKLDSHSVKTRIKIVALMSMGLLPGIFAILRGRQLANNGIFLNFTRDFSEFMLFGSVELGLIVILTSIPVLASTFEESWKKVRQRAAKTRPVSPHAPPELDMRMLEMGSDRFNQRTCVEAADVETDATPPQIIISIPKGNDNSEGFVEWSRLGWAPKQDTEKTSDDRG